ncbi:hypothetical protein, partial [Pontibacter populi]
VSLLLNRVAKVTPFRRCLQAVKEKYFRSFSRKTSQLNRSCCSYRRVLCPVRCLLPSFPTSLPFLLNGMQKYKSFFSLQAPKAKILYANP